MNLGGPWLISMKSAVSARQSSLRASLFSLLVLLGLSFTVLTQAGCTTHREVVATETTRDDDGDVVRHEVREVEVHDHDDDDDDEGVLSSLVGIIGDIIALPFRAVAGLFDLLF